MADDPRSFALSRALLRMTRATSNSQTVKMYVVQLIFVIKEFPESRMRRRRANTVWMRAGEAAADATGHRMADLLNELRPYAIKYTRPRDLAVIELGCMEPEDSSASLVTWYV